MVSKLQLTIVAAGNGPEEEDTTMISRAVLAEEKKRTIEKRMANYFGVRVEVLVEMENCSLILFGSRNSIVDTADLKNVVPAKHAA